MPTTRKVDQLQDVMSSSSHSNYALESSNSRLDKTTRHVARDAGGQPTQPSPSQGWRREGEGIGGREGDNGPTLS